MTCYHLVPLGSYAGTTSLLHAVSSAGGSATSSVFIIDKEQGLGLQVATASAKLERLAVPNQVGHRVIDVCLCLVNDIWRDGGGGEGVGKACLSLVRVTSVFVHNMFKLLTGCLCCGREQSLVRQL